MDSSEIVDTISSRYPTFKSFSEKVCQLFSLLPPELIIIDDSPSPRLTSAVLSSILNEIALVRSHKRNYRVSIINSFSCISPRIFFDTVLNELSDGLPDWQEGCVNPESQKSGCRFNETLDTFLSGLKRTWLSLKGAEPSATMHFVVYIKHIHHMQEKIALAALSLASHCKSMGIPLTLLFTTSSRLQTTLEYLSMQNPFILRPQSSTKVVLFVCCN